MGLSAAILRPVGRAQLAVTRVPEADMAKNLLNPALMVGIVALGGINYSNPAHSSEDEQSEVPLWATKADGYYEAMAEAEEDSSDASAEDEPSDVPLWATKADGYYEAMAEAEEASSDASAEDEPSDVPLWATKADGYYEALADAESSEDSSDESSEENVDEDDGSGFFDSLFSDDDE